MEKKLTDKKLMLLLACGILGCILMGGSDWLMIYGSTAYEGNLAWLTLGVAEIPAGRNALAMLLAFPAVIFYSIALFKIGRLFNEQKHERVYSALTAVGLTPWLCLHLLYVMILFAFGWLMERGMAETAYPLCEAMFSQFAWIIPLAEAIMLLPFIYVFYVTVAGKSRLPRWLALNNPLVHYVILKGLTLLMPDCPVRLAFTNGLMSEAMLLWFGIYIIFLAWGKNKKAV